MFINFPVKNKIFRYFNDMYTLKQPLLWIYKDACHSVLAIKISEKIKSNYCGIAYFDGLQKAKKEPVSKIFGNRKYSFFKLVDLV